MTVEQEFGPLDQRLPEPYADEIRGLAEAADVPLGVSGFKFCIWQSECSGRANVIPFNFFPLGWPVSAIGSHVSTKPTSVKCWT